jgi:tRNA(adenine34) deaminase
MTREHDRFMRMALDRAEQALAMGEFPVGCIMEYDGRLIAEGARTGTRLRVPSELDHAEIITLRHLEALDFPLDRSRVTLYCTLEPCLMCFGALLISGIGTIVYAYEDTMGGGTACDRTHLPALYRDNRIEVISGVGRSRSLALFKAFFTQPECAYWRDSLLARYTLTCSDQSE